METRQAVKENIVRLTEKGVDIPDPLSIHIGEEVDPDHISGNGVRIYPGCRIYGAGTVISEGSIIGREGPVTIENCRLGHSVELKGGYFKNSVFLEKAGMACGAHVREGCILEEQAGGAHCVGLKQTILFPFVTLGSLINFCDCLMAGGTSRRDHSEVGSSYIHFNFTPDGDKTTPSLIGDVPRGVMLNQPRIFLGGQGGIVGPVRLGFGNVVAAGTILRNDVPEDNKLIVGKTHRERIVDLASYSYPRLGRILENNLVYIANLLALEQWYIHVRQQFFLDLQFGGLIYRGAMENLAGAVTERLKRLETMAGKASKNQRGSMKAGPEPGRKIGKVIDIFNTEAASGLAHEIRDPFLSQLQSHQASGNTDYIDCIQSLPASVSVNGTRWLERIVKTLCLRTKKVLPSMGLFANIQ